jgi:hypothetical protein
LHLRCRFLLMALLAPALDSSLGPESQAAYLKTPISRCSPVDLREVFPQPVRNQGEISWCYANAAADYLQYLYRIPDQISAADIAIRYAGTDASKVLTFFKRIFSRSARNSPPETGFIALAVRKSIPEGWCPESHLPSHQWTRVETVSGKRESRDIMKSILEVYALHQGVRNGRFLSPADLPAYFEFPQIDQSSFFRMLKGSSQGGLLPAIRAHACRGKRTPYDGGARAEFKVTGKRIFQRFQAALDQREPISIDFFSAIFDKYEGFRRSVSDLHTVLIYGRRFNPETQECSYLMKNSYGTDCSRYDPGIRCEGGYLWFPESKLFPSLTSSVRVRRNP